MQIRNVLLIGGSGLIGSAIARQLTNAADVNVTVTTRNRERAKELILLPTVDLLEADVYSHAALVRLMAGQDAVVNLVGTLHSHPGSPFGPEFQAAHVDLARDIARACAEAGVPRLIHFSALGAHADAPSMYLRSKAAGEAAVLEQRHELAITIFRPSVVFGREDKFLNLFAHLQQSAPVFPLGRPEAKLQPVWVEDVAQAAVNALGNPATYGKTYTLAGPTAYTLKELVEFAGRASGHPRAVIELPEGLAYLQAWCMEFLPNPPLTRDNLDSLKVDNVVQGGIAPELGVTPAEMEAEAPRYLAHHDPESRLTRFRLSAGH